jgi:hypothetical protein
MLIETSTAPRPLRKGEMIRNTHDMMYAMSAATKDGFTDNAFIDI